VSGERHSLPDVVRRTATEALQLASILAEAEEVQWKPSLTPKPREDTTERSKGGHGDPTSTTAADGRRLAVRAAVIAAETDLMQVSVAMATSRERLERALDRWNGEVDTPAIL
jgi:hypothetical protein